MNLPLRVLFLCTGNSARSILAEASMNHQARGRVHAFSAGSHPVGAVRVEALAVLEAEHINTTGLRSKSWDEFAVQDAPPVDFIFTVCDNAANEACPFWPGHPVSAHWGVPDPAAVSGTPADVQRAFVAAYETLTKRIKLFLALPVESLDHQSMVAHLQEIGHS